MTVSDTQVTWLTQEAYDRLKHELDELVANRPVIAAKINDAREEGDLKENGGYHAAREEQAQLEARIRQLQELLRVAKVGDVPAQSGIAAPGMVVTVRFQDDDETETFLLGSLSTRRTRHWVRQSSVRMRARTAITSCRMAV
jgi:transcription elongation factor GreA